MRYPVILATISLIVFGAGFVSPASAQFTPNNNAAAGGGQDGSFVFVLQLDEQSLQDLRNGQPLLSKIPDELRNKVTAVRLEYIRNNNVSTLPTANPNGVATGQQFGPQVPDWFRNQNNSFPQSNPATTWNNSTQPVNSANNSNNATQFNQPPLTQPSNTNFSPQTQPIGTNGGLAPLTPRNEQIPAWTAPTNNSINPATGQGTGTQPNSNTPGNGYVPPNRPTNDSYNQGNPGSSQVDTAQQNPGYNNNSQQQQYEAMIGNLRQQIDQLQQQNASAGQRYDSLIPGHQIPMANSYADQTTSGFGPRGLLASVRGNAGFSDQLPAASIPGSTSSDPAVSQRRETASIAAGIEDANRKNGFLFFWLMCSIGLNIYRGWISQGFYARYRELADELRETFSTV